MHVTVASPCSRKAEESRAERPRLQEIDRHRPDPILCILTIAPPRRNASASRMRSFVYSNTNFINVEVIYIIKFVLIILLILLILKIIKQLLVIAIVALGLLLLTLLAVYFSKGYIHHSSLPNQISTTSNALLINGVVFLLVLMFLLFFSNCGMLHGTRSIGNILFVGICVLSWSIFRLFDDTS